MKTFILTLLLGAAIVGGETWYFQKHPPRVPAPPPVPEVAATSPDGTTLWCVKDPKTGEWVYFSTSGTSWQTTRMVDGHGATRTIQHTVPNTKR